MPVLVTCECGNSYDLKDEFAGKLVKCPKCGRPARAPSVATAVQSQVDRAFDRDIFLLRQQMLKISEKYDVGDEQGNKIIFVERPAHAFCSVIRCSGRGSSRRSHMRAWCCARARSPGPSAAAGSPRESRRSRS